MTTSYDIANLRRRIESGEIMEVHEGVAEDLQEVWPDTKCTSIQFHDDTWHWFVGLKAEIVRMYATQAYFSDANAPPQPEYVITSSTPSAPTVSGTINWSQIYQQT